MEGMQDLIARILSDDDVESELTEDLLSGLHQAIKNTDVEETVVGDLNL